MSRLLAVIPQAWGGEALEAALGAAQQVSAGEAFAVVLVSSQPSAAHAQLAARAGAQLVYQALHATLGECDEPQVLVAAVAEALRAVPRLGSEVPLVLLPPGPQGEELAALLADYLDGQALGRCVALRLEDDAVLAERAAWGGRMRLALRAASGPAFACLRAGRPQLKAEASADHFNLELHGSLPKALTLDKRESGQRLPPLEGAKLVVSGGRGVNEQGFALLEELALSLGGTLGGSLPAVDAGMVPVLRQVGVSGKFVSPQIYLAVGISGTLQHLAGVSLDSCIVAVNQDPEADIFKVASLGIVAPWETLLPALLDGLRQSLPE
ncbi:electron transfer flavoprotein subunit alpha/FixB family protein [Pseudomonas izuensis]|uniref:Electron transfer flavoprotein subunit alpha/FixB family protein n=1 Tax=Pseudomonas izuensis TaxID=2684212 RepID=A0ABM7RRC0_9PSED|nr:electron transfer flavoprotein subunit alpha/FixB family protein [Pseudomonas izuensis]BCX68224.1 electron transfer flavoprotein subunit alpha/FixB family protein [Pseudomonas izuensis]